MRVILLLWRQAPIDTQKALAERAVGPPAAGGTAPSPPKPPSTAEALMKR